MTKLRQTEHLQVYITLAHFFYIWVKFNSLLLERLLRNFDDSGGHISLLFVQWHEQYLECRSYIIIVVIVMTKLARFPLKNCVYETKTLVFDTLVTAVKYSLRISAPCCNSYEIRHKMQFKEAKCNLLHTEPYCYRSVHVNM